MPKGQRGWSGHVHGSFAQSMRASKPRRSGAGRPRLYGQNRQVSASLRASEVQRFKSLDPVRSSAAQGVRLALAHYLPYAWAFDPPPALEPSQVNVIDPPTPPTSLWLPDVDIEIIRQMGHMNLTRGLRVLSYRLTWLPPPPKLTPRHAARMLKEALTTLVDDHFDPAEPLPTAEDYAAAEKDMADVEAGIEAGAELMNKTR